MSSSISNLIEDYLAKNVEGTSTPSGYIIAVLKILSVSEGTILLNGHISFEVEYDAMILRPEIGEVLDCKIKSTNKMGFFANVGPLSIFIGNYQIPHETLQNMNVSESIRLKIIGTKTDINKVYAIGTMNDDFLGIQ